MNNLPQDPFILYSYINTKLRDQYRSLHELCDDLHISEAELKARLAAAGFDYDPQTNSFR